MEQKKDTNIKFHNAFEFVCQMQEEVNYRTTLIEDELIFYERKIIEIENELKIDSKKYKNALITPYKSKTEKNKSIINNLNTLVRRVKQLRKDLDEVQTKKNNIINLMDCLLSCSNLSEEAVPSYSNQVNINNILYKANLGKEILQTQEVERKRIARDLHDSTVQNLASLVHKIEFSIRFIEKDPIKAKLELLTISEIIKSTIDGMREIIYDLRPMTLNDIGLESTIKQYFDKLKKNQNMQMIVNIIDSCEKGKTISDLVNLTLYRIIQEACNNVIKYSDASTLLIEIKYTDTCIELKIKDDGIGFNILNQKCVDGENRGFGLSIMKERVYLLCGSINIRSQRNKGTQIDITVPYHDSKGELI